MFLNFYKKNIKHVFFIYGFFLNVMRSTFYLLYVLLTIERALR